MGGQLEIAARLRPVAEGTTGSSRSSDSRVSPTLARSCSLSLWRDEEAIRGWRNVLEHRDAQRAGRDGIFADYRLRIAMIVRDYGMHDRDHAREDSNAAHRR